MFADLHIHSCLSPCADNDMTPHNILGMASIKGLDIIAITDHNATLNLPSFLELQEDYGVQVMPGIEVTSKEEVHILGYFLELAQAQQAGELFLRALPDKKNITDIFGNQYIISAEDEITGELDALLIGNTSYSITEVVDIIRAHHGVAVPAHVNRGNNGMLINQGFIPEDLHFTSIEYARHLPIDFNLLKNKHLLISSDAHNLGSILEQEFSLPRYIDSKEDLFEWLNS